MGLEDNFCNSPNQANSYLNILKYNLAKLDNMKDLYSISHDPVK